MKYASSLINVCHDKLTPGSAGRERQSDRGPKDFTVKVARLAL